MLKMICEQNDNIIIEAVSEGTGPGKNYFIQPYAKVGVGQLNREASGNYAGGSSPPAP